MIIDSGLLFWTTL